MLKLSKQHKVPASEVSINLCDIASIGMQLVGPQAKSCDLQSTLLQVVSLWCLSIELVGAPGIATRS